MTLPRFTPPMAGPLPVLGPTPDIPLPALQRIPIVATFPTALITILTPRQGTMLWIIAQLRTDQAVNFTEQALRFNGDTGNNYADQRMSASALVLSGGESLGGANSFIRQFWAAGANAPANTFNLNEIRVPFFANAGNKQAFIDWTIAGGTGNFTASGEGHTARNMGLWSPGSPITSVTIQPVPGGVSYVAGSQIAAYVLN